MEMCLATCLIKEYCRLKKHHFYCCLLKSFCPEMLNAFITAVRQPDLFPTIVCPTVIAMYAGQGSQIRFFLPAILTRCGVHKSLPYFCHNMHGAALSTVMHACICFNLPPTGPAASVTSTRCISSVINYSKSFWTAAGAAPLVTGTVTDARFGQA